MNDANNVIQFPRKLSIDASETIPVRIPIETETNLALIHHAYIHDMVEAVLSSISTQLRTAGFSLANTSLKDGAFFVESLHSLLCQCYDMKHPFQKIANEIFEQQPDGDLRIVDELHIKFTEDEQNES